ncbi:hypothetical protein KPSA3_05023 [Pseudomonas syringae pv. actinidiae]|uniref:Uncharacterized protein n=1 Tax=Pseudomonas syringae pv. actinidiae TaxID=103796 RepID=A0AAN4TMI0_PSESF|nr:hypothetical protein KPSA3_05023 [Pseudomonas syringae pv. actinidiae]
MTSPRIMTPSRRQAISAVSNCFVMLEAPLVQTLTWPCW